MHGSSIVSMTSPHRISVGPDDKRIALARWGDTGNPPPPYPLSPPPPRGQGDSQKPAAGRYHFQDFAEDLCRVIEALDLSDIYGIGHSAGATDLLLAAKLLPQRFARLFVNGADHHGPARGPRRPVE